MPWRRRDWAGRWMPCPAALSSSTLARLVASSAPSRDGRDQPQRRRWRLLASGRLARAPWWPKVRPAANWDLSPREAFVHRHPLTAPFSVPSLGSCSGDKEQVAARGISPTPTPMAQDISAVFGHLPCGRRHWALLTPLCSHPWFPPPPSPGSVTFTSMPACRCWVRFGQATPGWVEPT